MSLLQRMKLLKAQDDADHGTGVASKSGAPSTTRSQDFEIKAVSSGGRQTDDRRRRVVHVSVSAGAAAAIQQQEQQHEGVAPLMHTSCRADNARPARTSSVAATSASEQAGPVRRQQPAAGSALRPLPTYRSLAQFSGVQEMYRSSQSVVFKATCIASRKEVILKQYYKRKMSTRAVHKMQREVELMHRLRGQEGVAQILGDFQDEKHYCIVMEYYRGGDLYKRSMRGEKPLSQSWICTKVIAPLLRVLSVLHEEHGIVHRDIKPENLFLSANDELMLGDFGLAIQQQQELPFLKAGTLDYMAPEVVQNPLVDCMDECPEYTVQDLRRHGFEPYNEKVDIWAVGVLAYELMMRGDTPFYHDEPAETEKIIMRCDLVEVHFPRQHLLSPWADFVRTTLQLDPSRRPSAAALLRHRWVQLHLQPRHRPPQPPRSSFVVAALDRSCSMPAMALANQCQQAVAGLSPGAALFPAASAAARLQAAATPAATPAASSSGEALRMLADSAVAAARAAAEEAAIAAAMQATAAMSLSPGLSESGSRFGSDADMLLEEAADEAGALGALLQGRTRHTRLTRGTKCTPRMTRATRATAGDLPMDIDDDEMVGPQPARRTQPALSLPLPRELAAMMRLAAPLGPPPLGPARPAPAAADMPGAAADLSLSLLQSIHAATLDPRLLKRQEASSPRAEQAGLGRKPSRLGIHAAAPSTAAAAAAAAPAQRSARQQDQQQLGPSGMWGDALQAAASAAAAAALGASLPPLNLRRMGRTGSVFRPPPPRSSTNDSGSPASPASLSAAMPGSPLGSAGQSEPSGGGTGGRPSSGGATGGSSGHNSDVRLGKSGQRNRLVAYLHRQTASAVGMVRRRFKPTKRSASTGGTGSTSSDSGGSDGGSPASGSLSE